MAPIEVPFAPAIAVFQFNGCPTCDVRWDNKKARDESRASLGYRDLIFDASPRGVCLLRCVPEL